MKAKWLILLLNVLDPGRHYRGIVTFDRPGSIRLHPERAAKIRRNKEREQRLLKCAK